MMVSGLPQKDDGALPSCFAPTFSPSSRLTFSTKLVGGSGCWDVVIDGTIGGSLSTPDCGPTESMPAFEISFVDGSLDNFSNTDETFLVDACTLRH